MSTQYYPPYTYLDFLDSSIPISMNSLTGELSFNPSLIQTSIYSVRVDEYRSGIKIGSVYRTQEILITPGSTGIADNSTFENNFIVLPNPASEAVNIRLNSNTGQFDEYFINDLAGKQLLKGKINGDAFNVDLSNLRAGVYFICIETMCRKLIVY
jgi:hypothetical protein